MWTAAALIVLVAIGAVILRARWNDDTDARHAVAERVPMATARPDDAHVDAAKPSTAARRAATPASRTLPKWPAEHPFELLQELAQPAYDGNADAQYRIAMELDRCERTLGLVRRSLDPEADIWNLPASWPQSAKERAIAEFHRCGRLLHEDPFSALPARAGGYDMGYWRTRAVESGQPLAVMERYVSQLVVEVGDSGDAKQRRAEAREKIIRAATSGNPDALLTLGVLLRGAQGTDRQLQGAAWMLAACRLGADCGYDSAVVPLWMCVDVQCQPGTDVETMVRMALSPDESADVQARYERISTALRAHDTDAIRLQLGFPEP